MPLSLSGRKRLDSESDVSDDDDMDVDDGSDSSSTSQLGRVVVTDSFSNE